MFSVICRIGFLIICSIAASVPLTERPAVVAHNNRPIWPSTWDGRPIRQIPLTDREVTFNSHFPGEIAKFSDGQRDIIFRSVRTATRQLHPSSDCFRGMGYRIVPLPAICDNRGARWGCFAASRGNERVLVREHITDEQGHEWTDVSA